MIVVVLASAGPPDWIAMRAIYLASVWLHVLAAMTWLGGMLVLVAAVTR